MNPDIKFQPTDSTETKVQKVAMAMRLLGHDVPDDISDLPDFPPTTFAQLTNAIYTKRLILQRFQSLQLPLVEDMCTRPGENRPGCMSGPFMLGILVIVVLASQISWWILLLLVVFIPASAKGAVKSYDSVVFRTALSSETAFCLLYRMGQVSVTSADYRRCCYWSDSSNPTPLLFTDLT
jgi:hypothetical protein